MSTRLRLSPCTRLSKLDEVRHQDQRCHNNHADTSKEQEGIHIEDANLDEAVEFPHVMLR